MPRGAWSKKDERQYKAILKSCRKGKRVCRRIAAAVVNKRRANEGRAKTKTSWNRLLDATVSRHLPPFNPKKFGVRRATQKECLYKSGKKKGRLKLGCVWGWGKYRGKIFKRKGA
jgi:hypothetical protein